MSGLLSTLLPEVLAALKVRLRVRGKYLQYVRRQVRGTGFNCNEARFDSDSTYGKTENTEGHIEDC